MKTIVSKRFKINMISGLVIISLCSVGYIIITMPFSDFIDFLPTLGFVLSFWLMLLIPFSMMYRGLLTVYLSDTEFVSKFRKKTYCKVSREKTIYYIRFHTNDDLLCVTEYVVVSNEPIHCKKAIEILSNYRMKTQVVIPYNEKTRSYMDFDKWTKCYPKKKSFYN